jgi:hypothetical protein
MTSQKKVVPTARYHFKVIHTLCCRKFQSPIQVQSVSIAGLFSSRRSQLSFAQRE